MSELVTFFKGVAEYIGLGALISAIILLGVKSIVGRMEQRMAVRTETRIEENMLIMKGICSSGGLSEAVAIAQKRGYANGETEEALEKYRDFKGELETFRNRQTATQIHGGRP